eukprot:GEMP01019312.1.p1 GENE.GEMP01019312.1~~GEMP01019312.1.p1  ORF type:complete len:580 (+),score=89.34 GEMP01019312.1:194-1933(+)
MELPGQVHQRVDVGSPAASSPQPKGETELQKLRRPFSQPVSRLSKSQLRGVNADHFVDDNRFHVGIAWIIIANAITIGLETDYGCKNICTIEQRGIWFFMDIVFTFLFTVEMVMRFYAHGFFGYFKDPWNRFDFVLVNLAIADTVIGISGVSVDLDLKLFTVMRIARIFRLVRLIKLVRAFRELHLLIVGMVQAFRAILWVFLIMAMILWCLAIFITLVVGQDDDPTGYDYRYVTWPREIYWGTVTRSMFSLYQLMTFDNWVSSLARPVLAKYPFMILFFLLVICVCTYGLVNIIVSIIVENTLSVTSQYHNKMTRKLDKSHKKAVSALNAIFQAADKDGSGSMDRNEFASTMKKRHVKDKLGVIGIRQAEMRDLFFLLDAEGSGSISIDQFQQGCLLIRGDAKSKEMVKLSMHVTAYNMHLDELCLIVEEQTTVLDNVLHRLYRTEKEFRDSASVEPKAKRKSKKRVICKPTFASSVEEEGYHSEAREPEAEPTNLIRGAIPKPPPLPPDVGGTVQTNIPDKPATGNLETQIHVRPAGVTKTAAGNASATPVRTSRALPPPSTNINPPLPGGVPPVLH